MTISSLRVVMPVHNPGGFFRAALASVLQDLGLNEEVVVVDDGSTDTALHEVADLLQDPRVLVIHHEEARGVSAAINAGWQHGLPPPYVAIAEHDDIVLPGRFDAQVRALQENEWLVAVSSRGEYVGPSGRVFGAVRSGPETRSEFDTMRARGDEILIPHPAVTYRRTALEAVGGYDPQFDGAQDLELMNRLVYGGHGGLLSLSSTHFRYRLHGSATSFAKLSDQRMMTRYVKARNLAQLEGLAFPDFQSWRVSLRVTARTRFRWWRHDCGAKAFRRAGLAVLERRPLTAVRWGIRAILLHPKWVWIKVRRQAGAR